MSGPKQTLGEWIRGRRGMLAVIAVAELIAMIAVSTIDQHNHIDGEVYQLGAKALLAGRDMYQDLPATESGLQLPFIYPPFAAIMFAPLALVSKTVMVAVITLLTHVALLVTLYLMLRATPLLAAHRDKVMLATAVALPLATLSEPVEETIGYSQINVVLMALVMIDCLWRVEGGRGAGYPRGMLVGIAAGMKLTPLAFLLFFLLRKDYRAMGTALATFVATVLVGFVVSFQQAKEFWLGEMLSNSNVSFGPKYPGDASIYAGNQSLRSVLAKLETPHLTVAFGALCLAVLVLAILGMRYMMRRGDLPLALTINAVLQLLMSPISWSHHWVWAVPGLVVLMCDGVLRKDWPLLVATATAGSFFFTAPHWKMPQGDGKELEWNIFQQLLGNDYVYIGLAFLVYSGYLWWRSRRPRPNTGDTPAAQEPTPAPAP